MDEVVEAFNRQFVNLSGHSPFFWQRRLFRQFMTADVPYALDLPTGLGKTSVMAIWLIARAHGATLPRRLVYIVDRRAVVDQATAEAEKLCKALDGDAKHLKEPLGLGDGILPISTLRGAYVDNRKWLDDPAVPAIVVGTVDMIGSRLLFEGYGVSRKMRPYHAGLLGADTLIVLDEAHLVPPLDALLRRIADGVKELGQSGEAEQKIVPPFRLLSLSATARSDKEAHGATFRLADEDFSDPFVAKRLAAKKVLEFVKIGDGKDELTDNLAQRAWQLSGESGKPVRRVVYCDSREVAERTKKAIEGLAEGDKKQGVPKIEIETELFVGARRVRERENAKNWLKDHGFLAGSDAPTKPAFLIATSAGEVGVDLDADHMVCDLVPWERMVQRLGRVNRRGEGDATIVVVHGDEPKPKKPEVPTDAEKRQITGFNALAVLQALPTDGNGRDASPGALRQLKLRAETDASLRDKVTKATTGTPLRPALTRALVDAWSMTSLEHHTGRPEIAPWLRGWVEDEPQTTVVWREHLPVRMDEDGKPVRSTKKEIDDFFEAAPPHESEKLETETFRVAEWLQGRAETIRRHKPPKQSVEPADPERPLPDATDKDEPAAVPPRAEQLKQDDIAVLIFVPGDDYERCLTLGELAQERKGRAKDDFHRGLVGKILIVDARFGGLTKAGMLAEDANECPETADAYHDWSELAGFRVSRTTIKPIVDRERDWGIEYVFVIRRNGDDDPAEWLVVEHYKGDPQSEEGRSIARPQALAEHQSWAEQRARDIAARVGFSGIAAEALGIAAFLHDEGKKAARWQRAFRAPREKDQSGTYKIFAKTRGPIDQKILDGYRHEFGSLPYAQANGRFKDLPEDWQDLVLHLIAAHHGFARPVIGTRGCEDAPPTALEDRAREVALRFARLQKRWGPWGLAWWEALLRAADQQASRDNDEGKKM